MRTIVRLLKGFLAPAGAPADTLSTLSLRELADLPAFHPRSRD